MRKKKKIGVLLLSQKERLERAKKYTKMLLKPSAHLRNKKHTIDGVFNKW